METLTPGPRVSRRTTLSEIAREAKVTVSTVSLVLSNKAKERRISAEVAERVWRVADELDYAPNLLVKSLQRGQTHVLSFFSGFRKRDRRDFYVEALATSVEQAGGSFGYNILVQCDFSGDAQEIYKSLNGGINDGLIFFKPEEGDPLLPYLRKSNLPTVLLNACDEEGILSSVIEDWQAGIREVVVQLLANGHRRIAVLTSGFPNIDARSRTTYLRECLAQAGIALADGLVFDVDGNDAQSINSAIRTLMNYDEPPTAIFCWHDHLGYRVLEECHCLKIDVPNRLSVVGYDGIRWPSRTTHVLASVVVDLDAMSKLAVEILVDIIRKDTSAPIKRVLPVCFQRGTTLAKVTEFD